MPEHELWLTAQFNDHLPGIANAILRLVHPEASDSARPWEDWIVMELLVVSILVVLVAVVRPRLSVENPGKLQQLFEVAWEFIKNTADELGIHHSGRYVAYFSAVFIFILFMNLIGIIPGFLSPTMWAQDPCGLAL